MGLLNNVVDGIFGGGGNASKAYDEAAKGLEPWDQAGQKALGQWGSYLNGMGNQLSSYGNPANQFWKRLSESPQDLYQMFMDGYEESPQYQQKLDATQKGLVNASAASGMLGSGSFYDDWQNNAYDILAEDQDAWLGKMMGIDNQQLQYLNDYRGTQQQYLSNLNTISQMGQNAATNRGQFMVGGGQARDAANPWGNMAKLASGLYLSGVPKYGSQGTYFSGG